MRPIEFAVPVHVPIDVRIGAIIQLVFNPKHLILIHRLEQLGIQLAACPKCISPTHLLLFKQVAPFVAVEAGSLYPSGLTAVRCWAGSERNMQQECAQEKCSFRKRQHVRNA